MDTIQRIASRTKMGSGTASTMPGSAKSAKTALMVSQPTSCFTFFASQMPTSNNRARAEVAAVAGAAPVVRTASMPIPLPMPPPLPLPLPLPPRAPSPGEATTGHANIGPTWLRCRSCLSILNTSTRVVAGTGTRVFNTSTRVPVDQYNTDHGMSACFDPLVLLYRPVLPIGSMVLQYCK